MYSTRQVCIRVHYKRLGMKFVQFPLNIQNKYTSQETEYCTEVQLKKKTTFITLGGGVSILYHIETVTTHNTGTSHPSEGTPHSLYLALPPEHTFYCLFVCFAAKSLAQEAGDPMAGLAVSGGQGRGWSQGSNGPHGPEGPCEPNPSCTLPCRRTAGCPPPLPKLTSKWRGRDCKTRQQGRESYF